MVGEWVSRRRKVVDGELKGGTLTAECFECRLLQDTKISIALTLVNSVHDIVSLSRSINYSESPVGQSQTAQHLY